MKKALSTLLGLFAAFAALIAVQLARLDPGAYRNDLVARAGEALGAPIEVDRVDLAFLTPALRLRGVRSGAAGDPGSSALALTADEVRLGLSLPALALGRVVLRSVSVQGPRLRVALGAGRGRAPAAPRPDEPRAGPSPSGTSPTFAITKLRIADGTLEAGPWRLEKIEASGGLGLDLRIGLDVAAEAPGLGRLRDGHVELSLLGSGERAWSARGALEDLDLAGLAAQLGSGNRLRGHGRLALEAEGRGAVVTGGELGLELPDAEVHGDGFDLLGRVALEAPRGGPWRLDLSGAELRVGTALAKPAGAALVVSAEPDGELPPRVVRAIRVRSEPFSLEARAQLGGSGARIDVSEGRIDLARLAPWWQGAGRPVGGAVVIHAASFRAPGADFEIDGDFEAARVALPAIAAVQPPVGAEEATLTGPFALHRAVLESSGLELALAGQSARLQGRFDLATHAFDAQLDADALDVGRILAAFSGSPALEGQLSAHASLSGAGDLDSIQGSGRFALEKGRIPGADFPWPAQVQDPRLVTGEEGRSFDSLGGRFFVVHGVAQFDQLTFHHPYLSAYLEGNVRLADGGLDLRGELEISEELDAGLGGEGRRRVLPVRHVGGRLADPKFDMDRQAMAATFGGYAAALRGAGAP